jgi:BASS family bile acid:Na+ symporter
MDQNPDFFRRKRNYKQLLNPWSTYNTPHLSSHSAQSTAVQFSFTPSRGMLLLSPSPPAPAAAVTAPRRILLAPHRRLNATSTPPRLACLRLRPATPLRARGIPSRTGCRAAADADAAPSQAPGGDGGVRGAVVRVGEALSLGFPVWVASACALALWRPPAFLWVGPTAQMLGLSFTMLGRRLPSLP